MPIKKWVEDKKPGFRYGDSGKCYTVDDPEDEKALLEAKKKAIKQAIAIHGSEAHLNEAYKKVAQIIFDTYIKLNFKCPKGTIDETFSCGKTPEEAKANYEKLQKDKASAKIPSGSGASKSIITIGTTKLSMENNPHFEKGPGRQITLYHVTNERNVYSIKQHGLDYDKFSTRMSRNPGNWFNSKKNWETGIADGSDQLQGDDAVIMVQIPSSEFERETSEQGVNIYDAIPSKYIKGIIRNPESKIMPDSEGKAHMEKMQKEVDEQTKKFLEESRIIKERIAKEIASRKKE